MRITALTLLIAVAGTASAPAADSASGNCPTAAALPGWDQTKWSNPAHRTPKYVVGRIVSCYPHTPSGLRAALPRIQQAYPGTTIKEPGKGDVIIMPGLGMIDVVQAAGEGGKAWQWLPVEGGGSSPPPPAPPTDPPPGNVLPLPDMGPVVKSLGDSHPGELSRACQTWEFLDLVVDTLRAGDKVFGARWGYNCKRGNCGDPSKDVIDFYAGPGKPTEGARQVYVVDIIGDCGGSNKPQWLAYPYKGDAGAGWTSRGRF